MYRLGHVWSHDPRRGNASKAPSMGERLQITGKLLGNRWVQTVSSNTHLARDFVKVDAERDSHSCFAD